MTYWLIDEPSVYEGLDAWRKHRRTLNKLPAENEEVRAAIKRADEIIAELEADTAA